MKYTFFTTLLIAFSMISHPVKDGRIPILNTSETSRGLTQKHVRSSHNNKVKIYEVKLRGKKFGSAVWMSRKDRNVQAKYFAFKEKDKQGTKSVYERYHKWRTNKSVILACSGGFSTEMPGKIDNNANTVGLTVDNGRIVNRLINNSMDGLVIVYATGGVVVSDIENKNLRIGSLRIDVKEDKMELLNWAVENNATIFQTQLLAYDGSLRISRAGKVNKRERRFLALARSKNQELFHVIFDIPEYNYLFDASKEVLSFLKETKNMDVLALLNLDTGGYNILELYKNNKERDFKITGDTDIKVSTNLIVYHLMD